MREVSISSSALQSTDSGETFLALGPSPQLSLLALDRIRRVTAAPADDVWGTFGMWDPKGPKLAGTARFSNFGEEYSRKDQSGQATVDLVQHVGMGLPEPTLRVRERFIDLSDVWVDGVLPASFTSDTHPSFRLTLFVRAGEGALVVVQHGRLGEQGVDFVQPEPTALNNTCTARDRLTYRIPIPFDQKVQRAEDKRPVIPIELQGVPTRVPADISIKILTFDRGNSSSPEVIKRVLNKLGKDRDSLLKWNSAQRSFVPASASDVKLEAKTLLMLHGTFSSTKGSFGPLLTGPRKTQNY